MQPTQQLTNKDIYELRLPDGRIWGQIRQRDLKRFENTARYISREAESILDVGCFGGDWLDFVLRKRPGIRRHLGIDVSETRIDDAKQRFPHLNVRVAYAEQLDLPPESFDVVTCLEVLEHIPDWSGVLDVLLRFARRQVLITVPNRQEIGYTACLHCGKLTPLDGHLHTFSPETFPSVLGWRVSFRRIPLVDPNWSLLAGVFRRFYPLYRWLMADYRRTS